MDDDTDTITAAAPAVTPRTPDLLDDLEAMVAHVTRPRRRRLRLVAATGVAVAALGAGSAAAGVLPTSWFDRPDAVHQQVLLSSGHRCAVTYAVAPVERAGVDAVGRGEALSAAQDYLARLDPDDIVVADAVRRYEAEQRRVRASAAYQALPPEERAPAPVGDDLELTALSAEVGARVADELDRRGLVSASVSVAQAVTCDE